ncbi:hypothetical protein BSKO_12612 [Bryopsis sp. KO-2023]|nr:hypothetical protein BSKO_12612 [Bryopsis sp. KO-2023]
MANVAFEPWCNAKTVAPPLIRYLEEKINHEENLMEWILTLRVLNKSWCLEMSSHIKKVTPYGGQLEQLPRSFQGSLAHVKNLELKEIGTATLAFDEEAGCLSMRPDPMVCDVLNSAVNIQTLSLSHVTENEDELDALSLMTSVKNLSLEQSQTLAIVQKCPNLENLTLVDCSLMKVDFECNPRLRSLSINLPTTQDLKIDNPELGKVRADLHFQPPLRQSLLDGLANLTELTQLRFSCCMWEWCDDYQTMCQMLSSLGRLKILSLFMENMFYGLDDTVKHAFLNALPPSLRELELWGLLSWEDNRVLMETTSLNSLEKLTLGNGDGRVSYADLEWVTQLPNLVELSLWGSEVLGRALLRLRSLPKLRRVVLNVERIDPEAFRELCCVGEEVKQIVICYRTYPVKDLRNDPMVLEAKGWLEGRGVEVKLVN